MEMIGKYREGSNLESCILVLQNIKMAQFIDKF